MKLKYFLFLFLVLSFCDVTAQTTDQNITIYPSKGSSIQGTLKGSLFSRARFKIITDNKTKAISIGKVDSLIFNNENYFVHDFPLKTALVKVIDRGNVNLFEVNGEGIGISRNSNYILEVSPNGFSGTLDLLINSSESNEAKINRNQFISKIMEENDSIKGSVLLPYDSVINSSNFIIGRISFLRPELGFEIKVAKPISFYSSIGMNFFGKQQRNTSTFINYDVSTELRYFFRQGKRSEKGKSNYNFSGPFIAGTYKYLIERKSLNRELAGLIFGWQDNSLFNSTFGGIRVGIAYDWKNEEYLLMSFLTLGWTLK